MFDPCITHQFALACKGLREISGPLSFQRSKNSRFNAKVVEGVADFERLTSWDVGPGRMSDEVAQRGGVMSQRDGLQNKKAPRKALFACLLAERASVSAMSKEI